MKNQTSASPGGTRWKESSSANRYTATKRDRYFSDLPGYQPIRLCGCGGYGEVWLVRNITGKKMALKIIDKQTLGNDWEREFHGLKFYQQRTTNHPNLIEIFHVEDKDYFFYYTMEPADNLSPQAEYLPDTLENRLKKRRCSPVETKGLMLALLNGIEVLHSSNLVHRDIKPANIVFVNGFCKLTDIGLVTTMSMTLSVAGTPGFIPPEEIINLAKGRSRKDNNFDVDLYALGKVIYCCFTGKSVESYPSIPEDLIHDVAAMELNRIVGMLCATNRLKRVCSVDVLRKMIYGDFPRLTFITLFYRYVVFSLRLIFSGFLDFSRCLWHSPWWVKCTLGMLIILGVWLSWDIMKAYYSYYTSPQDYIAQKHQEYARQINESQDRFDIDKIRAELTSQQRCYKLLYTAVFDKVLKDWKQLIAPEGNISFQNDKFIAGAQSLCDMINEIKLPDDYEISFDAEYDSLKASVRFSVCAMPTTQYNLHPSVKDYFLPQIYDDASPAQCVWGINTDAQFTEILNTQIPGQDAKPDDYSRPLFQIKKLKSSYHFKIIKVANNLMIFCNGNLLYNPQYVYFKGGQFGIAITSESDDNIFVIKNLKIYDISLSNSANDFSLPDAQPYEKTDKEYQTDLSLENSVYVKKVSPAQQPPNQPTKRYSWQNAPQSSWDNKTLSLYGESDACLRQQLPADYEISFSFTPNTNNLVLRFLKYPPRDNRLDALYYSYPAFSIVLTDNSVSLFYHCAKNHKFEVSTQKYSGNYKDKVNQLTITKFGGEVSISLGKQEIAHFSHGIFDGGFFSVYCPNAQNVQISNFKISESKYDLPGAIQRIISTKAMQDLDYKLSDTKYFDADGNVNNISKLNSLVIKDWSKQYNISPAVAKIVVKYISQPIIQKQFFSNPCFTVDSNNDCIAEELETIWTELSDGQIPPDIHNQIYAKFKSEYDILDSDISRLCELTDVFVSENKSKIEKIKAAQEKARVQAALKRQHEEQEKLKLQQEEVKREEARREMEQKVKEQENERLRENQEIARATSPATFNEKSYTIKNLILEDGTFISDVLPYKFELSFDIILNLPNAVRVDLFTIPNDDTPRNFFFSWENYKYSKLSYVNSANDISTYDSFVMKYNIGRKMNIRILHDGYTLQFICNGKPLYPLMPGLLKVPGKLKIASTRLGDSVKITNFKINAITDAQRSSLSPEACSTSYNKKKDSSLSARSSEEKHPIVSLDSVKSYNRKDIEKLPFWVPSLNDWQSRQTKHLDNSENIGWLSCTNSGTCRLAGPLMSQNERNLTLGYIELSSKISRIIAKSSWPENYTLEFNLSLSSEDNQFAISLFNGSIEELNKSVYYSADATEFYFVLANSSLGNLTYRKIVGQKTEEKVIAMPTDSSYTLNHPIRIRIVRNAGILEIFIDDKCRYSLHDDLPGNMKLIPRLDFTTTSSSDTATISDFHVR